MSKSEKHTKTVGRGILDTPRICANGGGQYDAYRDFSVTGFIYKARIGNLRPELIA